MNCYLGLGSNLGDSKKNLRRAIELISHIDGVNLISVSSFYETEPWGNLNQPNFINAAICIQTDLEPLKLLDELQRIENELGRVRLEHWGARTIDIDILYIDDITMDSDRLKLPHPFMLDRDFVLVPLSEINGKNYKLHGDKIVKTNGCLVDFDLKMIACVDKYFGLGLNGQLLFHIEEDLKRFRELTIDNTVIMGRKTFESIGKPLSNRRNIILSRTLSNIKDVEIVSDLESLYHLLLNDENKIKFVIGGGEIYQQFLPFINEAYITFVNESKSADTFLTNLNERGDFICDSCDKRSGFEFRHYKRRA